MRSNRWMGVLGTILLACGPDRGSGAGSGAGGSASHPLVIRVSGGGTVQSASPSVSCRSNCRFDIAGGGTVLLVATADSGNVFAGWQGDCSGGDACSLNMSGDRQVTAVFTGSLPPGTFRVTVIPTGTGAGRVTSNPAGIDCPSACTMTAQTGTSVALTAQAAQDSTFAGWGAACHGAASCALTASGDVWVDFEKSAPQCAGLGPESPKPPLSATVGGPNEPTCGSAIGDANGTIGLQTTDFVHTGSHAIFLHFMDGDSGREKNFTGRNGSNGSFGGWVPQPDGFIAVYNSGRLAGSYLSLEYWNGEGKHIRSSSSIWGDTVTKDVPKGGILVSGTFSWTKEIGKKRQVWMFTQDLSLQWTHDLASQGAIFGLGCDWNSRCLIITDGGSGAISAQWFEANGAALTGEFSLIKGFKAGPNTWFETSSLIGGGVAVRRVDQQDDSSGRPYRTAEWLLTVGPSGPTVQDAPQWLKGRRNTNFGIARGGKAYAFLPMGAPNADCAQKIEVLAPDGTSCGSLDATIASGLCRTEDVVLSLGGTPIQRMPEGQQQDTCSYRWWKDALR